MTTLSSKIEGIQLWAYDIARRPDKTPDSKGNMQIIKYTKADSQGDTVSPVTQSPTEGLTQAINRVMFVCDINHNFNGNKLTVHGIKYKPGEYRDEILQSAKYNSALTYVNLILYSTDIYIEATNTVTESDVKNAFTTKTPGIKIIDQSGIVQSNRGYALVMFEVQTGYKIPVGATIKANPKVQDDWGNTVDGSPETYPVIYDMQPGIYELPVTAGKDGNWLNCDIDFVTVQTATTPPETPTTPTTPTKPVTIPLVQKLDHVTSNITGASIDRKLNAISLTADPGYTFQTNIEILFHSGGKIVGDYAINGNGTNNITIPLNTTKENTIIDSMDNMQLTASATLATLSTGYEHNYLITDTELNAFSADKIWSLSHDNDGEEMYNISQFINNIIELPFVVNATTTVKRISVGREQSNTVSHETKERFVTLDLGTIEVPAKYKNGYDYQNKTIKLYTPFVPPITIGNENVINKTIHISYKVDISNGNLTVNLYNDDVLFFTGTNNIDSQLPFLNTLKNTILNRDTHFTDNDIRQPYIIVSRETPVLNSDYYPTSERGLIKSYNGSIQVRLLNNMNIPNNELSELTSQLESGVKYVKSN